MLRPMLHLPIWSLKLMRTSAKTNINRAALRWLLISACLAGAPLGWSADSFVALMYHRFGEDQYPSTNIQMDQFQAHLEYIGKADYEVIDLPTAYAFLTEGESLPDNAVLITVDDAYLSVYEEAFPLLQKYNFPFTVFVATDPVDKGLPNYMSWDQMREMQSVGVTFANHGTSHNSFLPSSEDTSTEQRLSRIKEDIGKGWQRLKTELAPVPGVFAYPYGEYDTLSANTLKELGYISFGQQSGAVGSFTNLQAVPRFPMNEAYGEIEDVKIKLASLPLNVKTIIPPNPSTKVRRPKLRVELDGVLGRANQLSCYVSGQGQVEIKWIQMGRAFEIQPEKDLPLGRSRVNCTVPRESGRFRWFSHPWFVQN